MAVRLKYGDGPTGTLTMHSEPGLDVEPDLRRALESSLAEAQLGKHISFFSTYTATIEIQRMLADRGFIAPYWDQ
jgi:hypothetical protein